jgi:hypothetical protein
MRMLLSDDTHDYTCTRCGSTGGVCMQALALGQRIARGLAANERHLPEGTELRCETLFTGCGRDCTVRLDVAGTTVAITCGRTGAAVRATRQPTEARGTLAPAVVA